MSEVDGCSSVGIVCSLVVRPSVVTSGYVVIAVLIPCVEVVKRYKKDSCRGNRKDFGSFSDLILTD